MEKKSVFANKIQKLTFYNEVQKIYWLAKKIRCDIVTLHYKECIPEHFYMVSESY